MKKVSLEKIYYSIEANFFMTTFMILGIASIFVLNIMGLKVTVVSLFGSLLAYLIAWNYQIKANRC